MFSNMTSHGTLSHDNVDLIPDRKEAEMDSESLRQRCRYSNVLANSMVTQAIDQLLEESLIGQKWSGPRIPIILCLAGAFQEKCSLGSNMW